MLKLFKLRWRCEKSNLLENRVSGGCFTAWTTRLWDEASRQGGDQEETWHMKESPELQREGGKMNNTRIQGGKLNFLGSARSEAFRVIDN